MKWKRVTKYRAPMYTNVLVVGEVKGVYWGQRTVHIARKWSGYTSGWQNDYDEPPDWVWVTPWDQPVMGVTHWCELPKAGFDCGANWGGGFKTMSDWKSTLRARQTTYDHPQLSELYYEDQDRENIFYHREDYWGPGGTYKVEDEE